MDVDSIEVTRFEQNCSVLRCERTGAAAVIDPGGDVDRILDLIAWSDATLELILVTHGHMDHCGAAADLAAVTGARIEGPHHADAHLVAELDAIGRRYRFRCQPYRPARWLEHGDCVRFGDERLEVLHCPGHTQGHVAYFHARTRRAFVGDILFRGAIGQWEHADGDLPQLLDTIRTRLFPLGDDVRFVPGHGPTSTFGLERASNPFVGDAAHAAWQARGAGRRAPDPDPATGSP